MNNTQLFRIYGALSAIGQLNGLPFKVSYPVARNMRAMKLWFDGYMEARKAAVVAAGGRTSTLNAMDKNDYMLLSEERKKEFEAAFLAIENEEFGGTIDWYKLNADELLVTNGDFSIPAALIEPLIGTVID